MWTTTEKDMEMEKTRTLTAAEEARPRNKEFIKCFKFIPLIPGFKGQDFTVVDATTDRLELTRGIALPEDRDLFEWSEEKDVRDILVCSTDRDGHFTHFWVIEGVVPEHYIVGPFTGGRNEVLMETLYCKYDKVRMGTSKDFTIYRLSRGDYDSYPIWTHTGDYEGRMVNSHITFDGEKVEPFRGFKRAGQVT